MTVVVGSAIVKLTTRNLLMSEEQLSALLAKLKEDAGLRGKLQGAGDLDSALAIAKEAGFDVSKSDWLQYQDRQILELSDDEVEDAAGGECRFSAGCRFFTAG